MPLPPAPASRPRHPTAPPAAEALPGRDPVSDDAWRDARHRARRLRGFYRHVLVYLSVNAGLIIVYLITQPPRPFFLSTLLGWGLGLAIHGFLVWTRFGLLGREWEERKIAEWMAVDNVRILSTEKQLVEARLRLLQAQIEPHFLFNTLANVVSLIEPAPARATEMLEHFIAYLRASLTASRATQGTVGQEAALLRDYLQILAFRMGERLSWRIDVDPTLTDAPLAPMLLQPVVENAIKHGLEPKIEGGQVTIRIQRETIRRQGHPASFVVAVIEDDGLGFQPSAHAGVGLDNLRERLAVLYDGRASLRIEERQPGTAVRIELPMAPAPPRPPESTTLTREE